MVNEPEVIGYGERWVVVNKPAGMLAHPVGNDVEDVLAWLKGELENNQEFAKQCDYDPQYELHPIHRLDREVSGLMLIALDKKRANHLHQQFEKREIEKRYRAVVNLNGQEIDESGEWTWKLTKKAEGRSKPAGFAKFRVPCKTIFKVVSVVDSEAVLELTPHTGRKHQLRRHCALAGVPILGDSRYGGDESDYLELRSCYLGFKDPNNGEERQFALKSEDE